MKLQSFILFLGILWAASGTGVSGTARADEFAMVAAGDPMYGQLAAVTKAGWLSASPATKATANTPHLLTRYEIALETAKAIFMVTARHRADATWAATAPRLALRALRDLTTSLRVELKKLDVDATSTLSLFDTLLKSPAAPAHSTATSSGNTGIKNSTLMPLGVGSPAVAATSRALNDMRLGMHGAEESTSVAQIHLSQRLRLTTTLLALARDTDDPFTNPAAATQPAPSMARRLNAGAVTAGAAWDITNWLSLRADYHRRLVAPGSFASHADPFGDLSENRMGGGVDVSLLHGVKLSGHLDRVSAMANNNLKATRLEGGLGFTTWRDRLSLTANLSRLVPEDSLALSSTAAGLNIDVDVTERLSLNLLYKKLFASQATTHSDGFVGGGISINF